MFKPFRNGLAISALALPLLAQAGPCSHPRANANGRPPSCDASMVEPTFTNLCMGVIQGGTYTVTNNTPVSVKLNYIQIQDNDSLPAAATAIVAAPTNTCIVGTSLASGASCNILMNLQPLALGTFNRVLQVGIDTRQVQISGDPVTALANCETPAPPVPPAPPEPDPRVAPIPLSTLDNVAILGHETITNTGNSVINGDVDLSPGTSITGFPPGTIANGVQHVTDATAATALADATTYYGTLTDTGTYPCTTTYAAPTNLAGATLTPGVYCFASSGQISSLGVLTLSGAGNYIFRVGSTFTTISGSNIVLTNGAKSYDVRWAIGSSATLGTNSHFVGIIDAYTSITLQTGASLSGRAWALNGAVTLDNNAVNPGLDT